MIREGTHHLSVLQECTDLMCEFFGVIDVPDHDILNEYLALTAIRILSSVRPNDMYKSQQSSKRVSRNAD